MGVDAQGICDRPMSSIEGSSERRDEAREGEQGFAYAGPSGTVFYSRGSFHPIIS